MKKQYLIKVISFVLIFTILFSLATMLLKEKWTIDTSSSYVQEGMYDLEENSIELCFMGNSQMIFGVSGMILLENYGISAYDTATGLQPLLCTYFNLKEIHKTQDIKTVVLDISGLFEVAEDAKYRMVFDSSPLSINKLQCLWEYCKTEESSEIWSYIFPMMKYHSRWNDLKEKDFRYKEMSNDIFRGNRLHGTTIEGVLYEDVVIDYDEPDESVALVEEQVTYFRKIVQYCQENNIELLLIKTPKSSWTKTHMEYVQELADEYGLDYLDFNTETLVNAIDLDVTKDFKDIDHLNARGAEKLTNYLGEYLTARYEYQDARKADNYDQEMAEAFYRDYTNKYLTTAITVEDALECLNQERYEILIQKSGEISEQWNENLQEKMTVLGMKQNIAELQDKNYVAYLSGGQCVYEESSDMPIEYAGVLQNGEAVTLKSDITNLEEVVTNSIGQRDLIYSVRGLNIAVYDKELQKIVRYFNICIDGTTGELTLR